MKTFRTATVNILNSAVEDEAVGRYKTAVEAIQHHSPDFVLLQEVTFPEVFESLLEEVGYKTFNGGGRKNKWGTVDYLVIASKEEIIEIPGSIHSEHPGVLMEAYSFIGDHKIHLLNCHLTWGVEKEADRLRLVEKLDEVSRIRRDNDEDISLSIMGGDFNTVPDSRSIRFLKGLDLGTSDNSTFWVDCGDEAQLKCVSWTSNHSVNHLGKRTAMGAGITHPELLPRKRIDYVFANGYVYGKFGSPLKSKHLRHPKRKIFTDHEPLFVDHLIP